MDNKYTRDSFAAMLDGREIGKEMSQEEEKIAASNGLTVVFGYSDDNIEVRGQVDDELGCFDGGDFWISRQGIRQWEQKELPVPLNEAGEWFLRALWCGSEEGAAWPYQTSAPHSTFKIYEDGELFCIGLVLSL